MSEQKPEYEHGGRRKGSGRKTLKEQHDESFVEFTVRLSTSQHAYIKSRASALGLSIAAYLRELVEADRRT